MATNMADETRTQGPPASGRPTEETAILVCQCGCTRFDVTKTTRTAVAAACAKCGGKISVKGNIALPVRTPEAEVAYAVTDKVVRPDPNAASQAGKAPTLSEQGYRTLRFKISEEQDEVISRALEAVRVLNCTDEKFRAQQWQGSALEYVCADFLAGVDPRALSVVAQMDEAVIEATAKEMASTGQTHLSKRRVRKLRNMVRDRVAEELGLIGTPEYVPPPDPTAAGRKEYEDAKAKQQADDDDDDRMPDEDRLYNSVVGAMSEYRQSCGARGEKVQVLVARANQYQDLYQRWANGGLLLRVIGDVATRDAAGQQPVCYVWMDGEIEDLSPDLPLAYAEAYEDVLDDVELEVVELLPKGYGQRDPSDQWEQPALASKREELR